MKQFTIREKRHAKTLPLNRHHGPNKGEDMNYNIQGLSIYAEERGTAEPALLFLHYWGGTSRTWRKVTAELEEQFKTVAYDARGWGKSDKTPASYKLADLADEALSLVKALGIKQYVLVGHSMGGKVAQLIASRRPEGLLGLILVAPAQPTPRHNPDQMREEQFHAYDNRENVLKVIGSGRLTARPPSPEIVEQIVEDSLSGSREATMAFPMKSILEDISSEVAKINVPTVLLAGELDQVDSIERHMTEVLAYLPKTEFKIIKGSGHLIPIDEPMQLAKEIAGFVATLAS
jgi:pimeloyl-ACP methyl ester carboxylesterase